ncbi:Dinucleoside triphosphate hydrolase [Sporothrix stenoceras]|uniref:Bis(5'-adenosyl)-triphosphatase n=1 Tax=Sporothrix stenoceras TaxID=5173 RepID=A0ABR3YW30_9PEZI
MSSTTAPPEKIFFGPFDVSTQVFYSTKHSFALVNIKPLMPGHVLVCPKKAYRRLTDMGADEVLDLFASVQVVQRMLAAYYFGEVTAREDDANDCYKGSFNIAIQDGPEAGQTVPHVHVHILPRIRGATAKSALTEADELYEKMAEEPGNVGGQQWDAALAAAHTSQFGDRPQPGGKFPKIEDSTREPRTMVEMEAETAAFRETINKVLGK